MDIRIEIKDATSEKEPSLNQLCSDIVEAVERNLIAYSAIDIRKIISREDTKNEN